MAAEVRAQVTFTMTLMDDGSLVLNESFMHNDPELGSRIRTHAWHEVEGTCDPEELAYTMWAQMESHI